jgi:hypothetical protein
MTSWGDIEYEVYLAPLDTNTCDRLLAGAVAPEDAPPGYADVVRLLDAAATEPAAGELAREEELVAMVATAVLSSTSNHAASPRRSFMPSALSRPRLAAALIAAMLACSGGLASAGGLPAPAQDVASAILGKVGISIPAANEKAGAERGVGGTSIETSGAGHGGEISELPTTTELAGIDKGTTISGVASNGKGWDERHGSGSGASAVATPNAETADTATEDEDSSESSRPARTPNGRGTGTADTASANKSYPGTSVAIEASGGRSAAGSGNAASGLATAESASNEAVGQIAPAVSGAATQGDLMASP